MSSKPQRPGRRIMGRSYSIMAMPQRPVVTTASDCSGLDTATCALRLAGISPRVLFLSEKDPKVRKVLASNAAPRAPLGPDRDEDDAAMLPRIYDDIMTRDNPSTIAGMKVDLYSAGPPCQPFSTAGLKQGIHDSQGRGLVLVKVLETIAMLLPLTFFIENVAALATDVKYKALFDFLLRFLRGIKGPDGQCYYHVEYRVLQTSVEGGLPQNRASSGKCNRR